MSRRAIILLTTALATAACGNDTPTSPTAPSPPPNVTLTASTWQGTSTASGRTATFRMSVNEMTSPDIVPLVTGTYELAGQTVSYSGVVSGFGGQDTWQLTLLPQPQGSCAGQPISLPGAGSLRTTRSGTRITGTLTLSECTGPSEWQVDLQRQ